MQFRKDDEGGGVKNYGGGEEPLRWLKSGDLQLLGEHMELARESGRTYLQSRSVQERCYRIVRLHTVARVLLRRWRR